MIWVAGAKGMLGQDLVQRLDSLGLRHVDTDLDCDITDGAAVRSFTEGRAVEWVINCSGYTAVDKAEDEEGKAESINADGPANLGRAVSATGARIIHLSTDYVFDGLAAAPYMEDQVPAPRGAYGRTKAKGEALLREATLQHFIVRTAWLYGIHGKNFVQTMIRLMNERDEVTVVDDQRGSPTYTRDLADALCAIVRADSRAYGTYHYTNEGETTWYRFARAIHESASTRGLVHHACTVRPITTDQYPTKAVRPKYSILSKEKIKRTFGMAISSWEDALERFLSELAMDRNYTKR